MLSIIAMSWSKLLWRVSYRVSSLKSGDERRFVLSCVTLHCGNGGRIYWICDRNVKYIGVGSR